MSLKVWLPLNGTLENKGASNIQPQLMGTGITYTAGKIGNAATFPNNANSCIYMPSLEYENNFSWCCWFKCINSGSGSYQFILSQGRDYQLHGVNIYLSQAGTTLYVHTGSNGSLSTPINLNQWYHVACTFDSTEAHLYLNGELKSHKSFGTIDYTYTSNSFVLGKMSYSYTNTGSYFPFNGQLNDVRIYDHCLSAAEVREISQGLVLHYKLGDILNPNLLPATVQSANAWVASGSTKAADADAIKFQPSSGDLRIYINTSNVWTTSGGKYTVSLDAKADINGRVLRASRSIADYAPNFTLTTNWQHYTGTITLTGTSTGGTLSLQGPSGSTIWVRNVKVERGEIATPFNLSGDTIIVQDSSGYNHNAISNGSQPISVDTDTPKYSYSTKFISGSRIAMPVASSTCLPTNAITVSIWYKSSAGTARFLSCTESGGWNFEVNSSKASFPFYINGKGYGRIISTKNFYSDNQWHMITVTYDGISTGKWYWDGILDNTITITSGWENLPIKYNANTPLTLGAEAQTIASPIAGTYVGNLSDLRIYCTALSAADVKQLYELGAKIDNQHNIHTFELQENNNDKITKTGITQGSQFSEYLNMSFLKYDPNIYIEPDGSCWVRVFHHNNPESVIFASNDTFTTSVYKDTDRWFNMELCNYLDKWEIMVKGKLTSTSTEYKIRWSQPANPMTCAYTDVTKDKVTWNTNGYSTANSTWGGLFKKNSSTYLAADNNTSGGNWWGAVGAFGRHQGGIPGYGGGVTTTGYEDVYLRIDNVTFSNAVAKNTKNKIWTCAEFIEL